MAKLGSKKADVLRYLYEQLQLFNYFYFVASFLDVMTICPLRFMLLQASVQQST